VRGQYAEGLEKLLTPVEWIELAESNPRRGDVDAVTKSYEVFGQRKPIVVRRTGEKSGVAIAGNHQLQAAIRLGWSHIAAVWVDEDEAVSRAFALADNRTHDLGSYDTALLLELLEEVRGEERLLAATAYSEDDLADLAAILEEAEELDLSDIAELNKRFSSMASRMLVIELTNDQFVYAQDALTKYREKMKLDSNAEALVKALEKTNKTEAPKWNSK